MVETVGGRVVERVEVVAAAQFMCRREWEVKPSTISASPTRQAPYVCVMLLCGVDGYGGERAGGLVCELGSEGPLNYAAPRGASPVRSGPDNRVALISDWFPDAVMTDSRESDMSGRAGGEARPSTPERVRRVRRVWSPP